MHNTPIVLMRDGEFQDEALEPTRVSKRDVIAKLREATARELSMVRAVILDSTGDVSVLGGEDCSEAVQHGT